MDSNPIEPQLIPSPLAHQSQLLPSGTQMELTKGTGMSAFVTNTMIEPVGLAPLPQATMQPQPPSRSPARKAGKRKDPSAVKAWNAMFDRLLAYKARHGNCLVPRNYKDDPRLGNWVSKQRANRATLSPERTELLDSVNFVWCVTARETWDTMFDRLVAYRDENGDCLVPYHYHSEDPKLVTWVYKQRTQMKKGSLSEDRVARLDSIDFVWFPQRNEWDAMLALLMDWRSKHGHCRVPLDYDQDPELSDWVFTQRRNRQKLSGERRKKLEAIGFEWHPIQRDIWDVMYQRLLEYKAKNGDCLVPQRYNDDAKLGRWVTMQRENKDVLSPEKRDSLEKIGFVWTVVQREPWNSMFQRLVEYKAQHGDCLVPQRYKENPRLGGWVREQRKRRDSLHPERKELLDSIGFAWRAKARLKDEFIPFADDDWIPV